MTSNLGVKHGPIACTKCFPQGAIRGCSIRASEWKIDNNPGYWGASNPEILVLGFSKGANQSVDRPFDEIAFRNARSNLAEILQALDVIADSSQIDRNFSAAEMRLGFASVVRCGLGKEVSPGKFVTSGNIVRLAVESGSRVREFFDKCTETFLRQLPERTHTVIFLGLDQPYIEVVFNRMKEFYPSIKRLSPVTYSTEKLTFLHVIHPSPLATSHRQVWLSNDSTLLAAKRRSVLRAMGKEVAAKAVTALIDPLPSNKGNSAVLSTPVRARPIVPPSLPERKIADLVSIVKEQICSGAYAAKIVGNRRKNDDDDVKKLLRIRRQDGEEFAIEKIGKSFRVWSSIQPKTSDHAILDIEEYPPSRSRHSNLGILPKLRGPKTGIVGAHAWKLTFNTPIGALMFIGCSI